MQKRAKFLSAVQNIMFKLFKIVSFCALTIMQKVADFLLTSFTVRELFKLPMY